MLFIFKKLFIINRAAENNNKSLPSTSSSITAAVVNDTEPCAQDELTNEQDQGNLISASQVENRQNLTNPTNSSDPALVEKLMQQLNDLKEMVST